MRADNRFAREGKAFWAHVRSISEAQGYVIRGKKNKKNGKFELGPIRTLNIKGIKDSFEKLGLSATHLVDSNDKLTSLGRKLVAYFEYRANVLNNQVQNNLMTVDIAKGLYEQKNSEFKSKLRPTWNKQKGEKAAVAYLTGLVNIILEKEVGNDGFNPNPGQLTTFTENARPLRTLSRRVDGALPGVVNPIAIWEIKEYYYTTTFGSRVADGVYETLLDGMELKETLARRKSLVEHLLILDAYNTWWLKGRSYLCRIIDMLNMGYVDEVLFGKEVIERLPLLAAEWKKRAKAESMREPQIRGEVEDGKGLKNQDEVAA